MLHSLFQWFRNDVFGPEIFGLLVEFTIVLIVVPTVAYFWRRANISGRLKQLSADLAAKLSRVQNAIVEIVIAIEDTIKNGELLQEKFGFGSDELQALLSSDTIDHETPPRNLTEEEKTLLSELKGKYFSEVSNFREATDSARILLNTLGKDHNLDHVTGMVLDVQESIRTIHRYSVRENLISDFENNTLPKVDRLLNVELRIGKYRFVREKVESLTTPSLGHTDHAVRFAFGRPVQK